jgi:geranylgeranyl reductase family protein
VRYDVVVVGTGPAGSTAAYHLARAGLRVALVEREALPRHKTCGGGLVPRAVRWLPVDVTPVVEHECRAVAVGLLPRGSSFVCRRAEPIIRMTSRAALDHLLAGAAAAAGAELLAPWRAGAVVHQPGQVRLETDRGPLDASAIIAADGATGAVSGAAGWAAGRRPVPALEIEAQVDSATFARFRECARVDFGIPRRGYAWVFPKADHLSIGVLSTTRGKVALGSALETYLHYLGIVPRGATRHGYVIPLRPERPPFMRGRVMVVGDAAGLADPLTAEGISYAALSGRLAAQALIDAQLDEGRAGQIYDAALRRLVLPELRAARLLARVVYGPPPLQAAAYRTLGRSLANAITDVAFGEGSYARSLARHLPGLGRHRTPDTLRHHGH